MVEEQPKPSSEDRDLPDPVAQDGEQLDELRSILFGREAAELEHLRERVDSSEVGPEEVGEVLPEAIRLREKKDEALAQALSPTVERAIQDSVKRNPKILADSIFPLMGPAIRKAIREALASMLEGINQKVESSLSPQGIRWRLEAKRTGKSYAEVVLLKSIVFRVEEVFLVHRESGLLLEHVVDPSLEVSDPDLVSAMMQAIQDFVSDSFSRSEEQTGLNQIEFGPRILAIEQGPLAILAAVVRGKPPTSTLRGSMEEVIEEVHREHSSNLTGFEGDTTPFLLARPRLESLLIRKEVEGKKSRLGTYLLTAAVVVLGVLLLRMFAGGRGDRSRWENAVADLKAEPGIVVVAESRSDGVLRLEGLRDPRSRSPEDLLTAAGIDPGLVQAVWEPYSSLEPIFVLASAEQALEPPDTVGLEYEDGVLFASGIADPDWIAQARERVRGVAGVHRFDESSLEDSRFRTLEWHATRLQAEVFYFRLGSASLESSPADLDLLRGHVERIGEAAEQAERSVVVEVLGSGTAREADEYGQALFQQRAEAMESVLRSGASPKLEFHSREATSGEASSEPTVTFRVSVTGQDD